MKILKRIFNITIVLMLLVTIMCSCANKATKDYFSYWSEDSKVVSEIKEIVEKCSKQK